MSKQNHRYERRTSWEVVITYLFVVILCGALFYYIFNLRKSIDSQRSNIDMQHATLDWVSRFTKNVHGAQNAANLYAFTEQAKYQRQFNSYRKSITTQVDSLMLFEISEDNKLMVKEIDQLLKSKGRISNELSRQFHDFNPLAEFDRTIEDYRPPQPEDEIVVTTVAKDTIVRVPKTEKKGFWGRVGNVFRPSEETDSLVHVTSRSIRPIRSPSSPTLKCCQTRQKSSIGTKSRTTRKRRKPWSMPTTNSPSRFPPC